MHCSSSASSVRQRAGAKRPCPPVSQKKQDRPSGVSVTPGAGPSTSTSSFPPPQPEAGQQSSPAPVNLRCRTVQGSQPAQAGTPASTSLLAQPVELLACATRSLASRNGICAATLRRLHDSGKMQTFFRKEIVPRYKGCGQPLPDPGVDAPLAFVRKCQAIDRTLPRSDSCTYMV
ncbi:MAG: hypothetical protein OXC07_11960, partial [Kistimonas sp.]|nr:hypothetical protein [Kistimonas sp.]